MYRVLSGLFAYAVTLLLLGYLCYLTLICWFAGGWLVPVGFVTLGLASWIYIEVSTVLDDYIRGNDEG